MSNSVQPHRRQPTELPHPWDSPGKNTGVGCHFLLQCVKVRSLSCIRRDPMDCSLSGSSAHGIFQARVLEWGAIAFSVSHFSHVSRFSHVLFFVTLWTVSHQAPLSMGFFRQGYQSGFSCPPPGDLPDLGIEPTSPTSPTLQVDS